MGKIVFMFPGQGAQYVGMGKDFYDSFACSKEIFDKANEVLDIDVKKLCFEENEDINITEYTQAAMVTASVAILKKIEEMGLKPDLTAGLSLGEYCALVASDVMSFESGDEVVVLLSGLGATPVMEQYIVYNRVEEILTEKGIKVHRSYVGNYFTSLEMMGVTLTVMKLDDELKECIDMPANSVGLKQF